MKYFVTLADGREVELEIEATGPSSARVTVDGVTRETDFHAVGGLGQYAVGLDALSFAASIESRSETDMIVNLAGLNFPLKVVDEREQAAEAISGSRPKAETIRASMPGIVVAVNCQAGDRLEPGDAVLVLEAMKMQNEIRSEHGGVVEEVLVNAGESVAGNQTLVKLVPADDEASD